MRRRRGLGRAGASSSSVVALGGCLLSGLAVALVFVLVLQGCSSGTNSRYPGQLRGGMRPPEGPGVYEITTRLEVTPAQLPVVRAVLEDAEEERAEIFAAVSRDGGGRPSPSSMGEVRSRMDDLNERTELRLAEVLTAAQMKEYREMLTEADRMRQQAQSRAPVGPGRGAARGGGW